MTSDVGKRVTTRAANGLQIRFVDTLGWGIFGLWAGSFLLDMMPYDYDPPAAIHGLMSIVATAAFASQVLKRTGSDE